MERLLLRGGGVGVPLGRGDGLLDGEGVDLLHLLRQCRVHKAVPLQQPLTLEVLRHDSHFEARSAPSHNHHRNQTKKSKIKRKTNAYPPDVSITTWNARNQKKKSLGFAHIRRSWEFDSKLTRWEGLRLEFKAISTSSFVTPMSRQSSLSSSTTCVSLRIRAPFLKRRDLRRGRRYSDGRSRSIRSASGEGRWFSSWLRNFASQIMIENLRIFQRRIPKSDVYRSVTASLCDLKESLLLPLFFFSATYFCRRPKVFDWFQNG